MKIHPHDLLLQEFAATFPEDRADCLDHLIECGDCRSRFRQFFHSRPTGLADNVVFLQRWQAGPADYDPSLDRISRSVQHLQSAYEREWAEAPGLFAELTQYSLEKRRLLIHNSSRFHTWGFCELLLRRSREQNFFNTALAESLANLALELLDRLDDSYYGVPAVENLRARAWAHVANSRRVKADLRGAEEAFALAFACLRRGVRDPMDTAVILDLQASLLRAQRRFGKSRALLRRAAAIFLELGEKHRAGRALINLSTVHDTAGETEKAIPPLYEALQLIDPAREPRVLLIAWHNLINYLTEMGHFMEAQKLFVKARSLYQQFPEDWVQNRRKWVEGKISRGLGQQEQAESLLLIARDGFLAENAAYDTALVSLELASLYAEQSRMSELKRVAGDMMPIFSSRQIHREALAALAFWRRAVQAERACIELVTGVASFLKRARHDPELRFEKT